MAVYKTDANRNLIKVAGNYSGVKVETIYDMSSNNGDINWGYISGIGKGITVNKDFSKYKKLIVYFSNTTGNFRNSILCDIQSISGITSYQNSYYAFSNTFFVAEVELSSSSIKNNSQNTSNEAVYIYKIEGVF